MCVTPYIHTNTHDVEKRVRNQGEGGNKGVCNHTSMYMTHCPQPSPTLYDDGYREGGGGGGRVANHIHNQFLPSMVLCILSMIYMTEYESDFC